mgnify:CR=1 FL=1
MPIRYALRLGNLSYPHMKLIIDRSPDGKGYLLRADTHDAHIQPKAGSREQAAFPLLGRDLFFSYRLGLDLGRIHPRSILAGRRAAVRRRGELK